MHIKKLTSMQQSKEFIMIYSLEIIFNVGGGVKVRIMIKKSFLRLVVKLFF